MQTYVFSKPADVWTLREELPLVFRQQIAPERPNQVILMPNNHFQAVNAEKGIVFWFSGSIGERTALPDMEIAHINGNPFLLTGDDLKKPKRAFLQAASQLGQKSRTILRTTLRKLMDRTDS
jgi:hypothetical protein